MEYLFVVLKGEEGGGRDVLVNDTRGEGLTSEVIDMPEGHYTISLDGNDYQPPSIDVALEDTTRKRPKVVLFEKL